MINVPIDSHDFEKVSLFTMYKGRRAYDVYKCKCCGLQGRRYGVAEEITVKRDKILCAYAKGLRDKVKKCEQVIITDDYPCNSFGFIKGIKYDRVPCPEDQREKFADDVWVFSDERGEPVRLLNGEFSVVE